MVAYVLAYGELFVSTALFFYWVTQYEVSAMLLAGLLMATVYGLASVLWMHYRKDKNLYRDILIPVMGFFTISQAFLFKDSILGWYFYIVLSLLAAFIFKGWFSKKEIKKSLMVLLPVVLLMMYQVYLLFSSIAQQGGLLQGQIWHNFSVVKSTIEGMALHPEYQFIAATVALVFIAFGVFPFSWLRDKDYIVIGPAFGYVAYALVYRLLVNASYSLPDNFSHLSILFLMVLGALVVMSFNLSRFYSVYALVPIYAISLTTGKIDFEGFFVWAFFLFIIAMSITPTMDSRWALWHMAGGPLGMAFWGIWMVMLSLYGMGFHLDWWLMLLFWLAMLSEFTRIRMKDMNITDEMVLQWMENASLKDMIKSSMPGLIMSFLSIFIGWWGLYVVSFTHGPVRPYNLSLLSIKLPFGDVNTPVSALVVLNMVVIALMWLGIWYSVWESFVEKQRISSDEMVGDNHE
ncbi:MAG: hypothetical protein GXO59_02275 [Dictyoglomi bacterium]|nr:hypothetical protein [Dictyoglomota bacterium]